MARPQPTPKTPSKAASGPGAEQAAAAALSAGKFREAAEFYKDLLKHDLRPEWKQGLADAYAGRARQMAAKGMFPEAIALWRTRSQACGLPLLEGPYVDWLAQSGSLDSALPALLTAAHEGPPEQQSARQGRLAATVLAAAPAVLAQIPADSPLMQHHAAARQALAALAADDTPTLEAALQRIPFRSPYRDLRPVLKAMALVRTDAAAAAEIMARVAVGGPFEGLAAPLRVAVQPAPQWLAAWHGLPAAARELVLDLKGCPPAHRPLIEVLAAVPNGPAEAPAGLFKVLTQYQKLLPRGLARRWALRLWAHMEERRSPAVFIDAFGHISEQEAVHAHALAAEMRQDAPEAEHHWQDLAGLLGQQPSQKLRAALILRRLARRLLAAGVADDFVVDWLEKSLDLDPDDRSAHLDLIRAWRLLAEPKQARERLEAALARWPEDTALLQQGIELALESGAFKKAATLAKQVQRLDPLNPRVPDLIGQAHLSHARKLIKSHKQAAALRELDQAATWLRGGTAGAGRLGLLRALAGTQDAAAGPLRQALAELGGPLVGTFLLALESQRVRGNARAVLAQAGHDARLAPTPADVLALAHALNAEPPRDRAVAAAIEVLLPRLQQAARSVRFSEDEFVLVAEALHRHRLAAATGYFTAAGRLQWPANRVLLYLDLAAAYIGKSPWHLPPQEALRLRQAVLAAQEQGDTRTAKRIADLLNGVPDTLASGKPRRRRMRFMGPMDFYDDDDDDFFMPEISDMDAIESMPAAQLIEFLSASLRPGELDIFRANTKNLSPEQFKQQLLLIAEQLRSAEPPPQAPRKRRK
jgi:cellulose synthase operon protein C